MPARRECAEVREDASRAGKEVVAEVERQQEEYDRITDHGRTQEVWKPPSAD